MKRFIANFKEDAVIAAQTALVVSFVITLLELPIVWLYLLSRYVMAFVGGLAGLLSVRAVTWLGKAAYRAIKNRKVIK